jgi:adenylate cyclase
MSRRLAAILSMDVVGYSRLMERDEDATLAALNALRVELINPLITFCGGKIIKLMGDGSLLEFASAVDAVRFAITVQIVMRELKEGPPVDPRIVFRIGINVGDVIAEDNDIYGDGVNLAARLEALAEPGGICIHRSVRDQVRDKLSIGYEDLGEVKVKNIERTVRAFNVVLDSKAEKLAKTNVEKLHLAEKVSPIRRVQLFSGIAIILLAFVGAVWLQPWEREPETAPPVLSEATPSIVVLPFTNLSGDSEIDYLGEGFSAAVRTQLSKFPELFVIAGSTSTMFLDNPGKARDIGKELGVRYVLDGSMQRHASSFSVNAALIEIGTGHTVWAEQYDFPTDDMFSVQADLVQEIVATLHVVIESEEISALRHKPTENPNAYDLYLRAVAASKLLTSAGRRESIRLLIEAVELDLDYLAAHSALGGRYLSLWRFGGTDNPDEVLRLARYHAERALEIDQTDYRGQYLLGMLHLYADHEHDLAYAAYQRALHDNPNDADIFYNMGFLRSLMGEPAEAIEWNNKAKQINPRYPGWYNFNAALSHYLVRDYDKALLLAKAGIAAYPKSLAPRRILIATLVEMGRLDEAKKEVADFLEIKPSFRLSTFHNTPFQNQTEQDRYFDAMRSAGIPN